MGTCDTRERIIADSQFGGGASTWAPATWYLGLSSTAPSDDGTGFTEVAIGLYAYGRVAMTNSAVNFPAATTVAGLTTKTNGTKLTFPNPTGLWGLLSYYGWFVAASGGTPEFTNPLDTPITVQSGNTPVEFAVNGLIMAWD